MVSIASNIAEGHGRYTRKDYLHFLSIANGSANEVRTQIRLATRLGYLERGTSEMLIEKTVEVSKLIKGIRKSIEGKS